MTWARIFSAVLCVSSALAAQSQTASAPVAEVANIHFHSDMMVNLHHTLYAAAWSRRPNAERRSVTGGLPAPLDAPINAAERAAWGLAVDYYDQHVASRDLIRGPGMAELKEALIAGDLASNAVGPELRAVLESAAPVYRRRFWPEHDRSNRSWIAATTERMKAIAPSTIARLETLYDARWFSSPARADVVWIRIQEGAYVHTGSSTHATISIADTYSPLQREWTAVEIVFRALSHVLSYPLRERLERELGDIGHPALFGYVLHVYLTGETVKEVLTGRGVTYTPHMYSTGLINYEYRPYRRPLEQNWGPYAWGKIGRDEAIAGTVKMLKADDRAQQQSLDKIMAEPYGPEAGFRAWEALAVAFIAIPILVFCYSTVAFVMAVWEYRRTRGKSVLLLGVAIPLVVIAMTTWSFASELDISRGSFGAQYLAVIVLLAVFWASRWFQTRTFFPSGLISIAGALIVLVIVVLSGMRLL